MVIPSNGNRWLKMENVITKEVSPSEPNTTLGLVDVKLGLCAEGDTAVRHAGPGGYTK